MQQHDFYQRANFQENDCQLYFWIQFKMLVLSFKALHDLWPTYLDILVGNHAIFGTAKSFDYIPHAFSCH